MDRLKGKIKQRPYLKVMEKLRQVGLRPTRQRLALAKILFEGPDRHVTAEILHKETIKANINIALATVYNCLHQFTNAGLLRKIMVVSDRTYFDTNLSDHYHYFLEKEGRLVDIPEGVVKIDMLAQMPPGKKFSRLDVVVHVTDEF